MTRMIRTCCVALAILFASSPTFAQSDAENIRARLKPAQKVSIIDDQGREFKGRISSTTADGLSILVKGQTADVPYARIVRIDRPSDGLANGALIGFGVGAALAVAAFAAEDRTDCAPGAFYCFKPSAGDYVAATLIVGGLGTAVGVGIDALIRGDREIYRRGGGARTTLAPALGRGVRGVVVSVTW